ncbi:MAG TPA: heavy metal-binding domain-containing protein [Vicinamibacteria bacterium]
MSRGRIAKILVVAAVLLAAAAWAQAPEPPVYVCPMHPEVVATVPGACPKCGMALVKSEPIDADYALSVEALPPTPRAGERLRLRFTVNHPTTGALVRDFSIVHEKPFHLFVVSQDLEDYQHVHPEPQPDGSLAVDLSLARPGYYKLYADFLPLGGRPQVLPEVLVTSDTATDLASSGAHLVPDLRPKTSGTVTASLSVPAAGLAAGRDEKLVFHVTDAATGAPVTDLEPYLGAFGHTLVMSEDTLHYVHAHPVEALPAGVVDPRGGPDLTFKALLPRPGRYRIWTQLKRAGVVSTVSFTVEAASPGPL